MKNRKKTIDYLLKSIYYIQAGETESLDVEEIITNGKKVDNNYIRLYKHTANIKVVLEDLAGNKSDVINITIPEEIVKLYGDVNLDGQVSSEDATSLAQYIQGENTYSGLQKSLADVNLDGVIDKEDETILEGHISGDEDYIELPIIDYVNREM